MHYKTVFPVLAVICTGLSSKYEYMKLTLLCNSDSSPPNPARTFFPDPDTAQSLGQIWRQDSAGSCSRRSPCTSNTFVNYCEINWKV